MAKTIADYLVELKRLLNGRIPAEELGSLLSESEAHLEDLKLDMSSSPNAEQLALEKFGRPKAFARRILKDRRQPNIWKAALWPMAILMGCQIVRYLTEPYGGLALVVSNGQPMHPFSFMFTPLQAVAITFLVLYLIACFKARRLMPVQIAIVALILGCVNVASFSMHGPIPTQGRAGIAYAEVPQDLQRLADAQNAFAKGPLVFSGEKKLLQPGSEFLVAGRYALPLWFLEKGVRGARLFINSHATGWGMQVYRPNNTLPDPTMFTTADWKYATAVWTPHFLRSYQAELTRDLEEDKLALTLPPTTPVRVLTPSQQVGLVLDTALHGFVMFFSLNLIAWLFGWFCDSALLIRRRYRRLA